MAWSRRCAKRSSSLGSSATVSSGGLLHGSTTVSQPAGPRTDLLRGRVRGALWLEVPKRHRSHRTARETLAPPARRRRSADAGGCIAGRQDRRSGSGGGARYGPRSLSPPTRNGGHRGAHTVAANLATPRRSSASPGAFPSTTRRLKALDARARRLQDEARQRRTEGDAEEIERKRKREQEDLQREVNASARCSSARRSRRRMPRSPASPAASVSRRRRRSSASATTTTPTRRRFEGREHGDGSTKVDKDASAPDEVANELEGGTVPRT